MEFFVFAFEVATAGGDFVVLFFDFGEVVQLLSHFLVEVLETVFGEADLLVEVTQLVLPNAL